MLSLPLLFILGLAQVPDADLRAVPADAQEQAVILDDYVPCGLVSLHLVCRLRDVDVRYEQIKAMAGTPRPDGVYSFEELSHIAAEVGLHPVGLHVGLGALRQLPMPAIAQMTNPERPDQPPHFLVLLRAEPDGVYVLDAPYQPNYLPNDQFQQYWTGILMVFARDAQQAQQIQADARARQGLTAAVWVWGIGGAVGLFLVPCIVWLWGTGPHCTTKRLFAVARPWKKWLLGGLVFLGVLAMVVYAALPAPGPRCLLETSDIDLGELSVGDHTIHVPVVNAGGKPLQITEVVSSCTCAVVTIPDAIHPGGRAMIEVALSATPGPRTAVLKVVSNDPTGPKRFVLHWNGGTKLRLVPSVVAPSPVPIDQPFERTVQVVYPGGKSAVVPELERWECASALVQVSEGPNDPVAVKIGTRGMATNVLGRLDLQIRVQPPSQPGRWQTTCHLVFACGKSTHRLSLPLIIEFTHGPLTVDVGRVVFSATKTEELIGQERWIEVTDRAEGGEFVVEGLPDWLACEVKPKSNKACLVKLKVSDRPPQQTVTRTVRIKHTQGSDVTVSLPVHVVITPP